jgi:ABC-type dipeptide/oligopeptide/nickel transport system permease component
MYLEASPAVGSSRPKEADLIKYILRRLLVLPLVMFLVTLILFAIVLQLPAEERVRVYLPSVNPHITEEEYARLVQITIERYGLDQPFTVQYVSWIRNLLRGEWGYSPSWRQPVLEGLVQRVPATIELTLFAMVPSIALAIVLGSVAARRKNRLPDHLVRAATFVGWAMPSFILGLVLMNVLYAWLGWFPPERMSIWASPIVNSESFRNYTRLLTVDALLNNNVDIFWDAIRHLVLPGVTLALAEWALLARIMRSSMLDVLRQDYITTARAKGLRERVVVNRHARRNAILPLVSAGGAVTSMLISGVVVIEVIFNLNGIGRGAIKAIFYADIMVTVGFAVFSCAATVLASLIADVLYAVVDARVRLF